MNKTAKTDNSRQGQRLVHMLVDIINIVSLKGLASKILKGIFKVLTVLLRSKKT